MTTYNCVHSGDQYRITKFTPDGNVESSYLCDHVACECPAGVRDTCRHRQMLPAFLNLNLVNTYLFLDWDNGRRVVDFNGLPATVQSNETCDPDLAPQALTDTIDRPATDPNLCIDEGCPQAGTDHVCIEPAKPANGWRRW